MTFRPYEIDDLAHLVASDGIDAHAPAVKRLAAAGLHADVSPVVLGVLTDPSAPGVARLRAFGRVAVAVARSASTSLAAPVEALPARPVRRAAALV